MGANFDCPHCGQPIKAIGQRKQRQPQQHGRNGNGAFTSDAELIPALRRGPVTKALDRIFGYAPPGYPTERNDKTIRIDTYNQDTKQITLHDMDSRCTFTKAQELAMMITNGDDWTRDNIIRYTSIKENAIRVWVWEFKRFGYIEVSTNNRTTVTASGRRFLRGVLAS